MESCEQYLVDLDLSEGWIPIFDKSKDKSWDEKIYTRDEVFNGKIIHIIGLSCKCVDGVCKTLLGTVKRQGETNGDATER